MNRQQLFVRKIVYMVAIIVLLLLLIVLGQPGTKKTNGSEGSLGGLLARLRSEGGFSEADLGDVDPASETLKLATLGMRGVAANILWEKANTYKMKKDWTNLGAALEQIAKLEPHFIEVWRYQSWNLSYNVSTEFDDYRERYRWVIKGFDYLNDGIQRNRKDATLVWWGGWTISQKIGRADESRQFRRLLKQDDEFFRRYNDPRPIDERDNWLVGRDWYLRAYQMVDQGATMKKQTPAVFFSNGSMCLMNYADYLEKDGVFDEKAYIAWKRAEDDWYQFGDRLLPSTFDSDKKFRLNDKEEFLKEAAKRVAELEKLAPGVREQLRKERYEKLSPAEKKALDTPLEKRTTRELYEDGMKAEQQVQVTYEQIARKVTGKPFARALELAREAVEFEQKAQEIDTHRQVVNFDNWRRRAMLEKSQEMRDARKWIYLGDEAIAKADTDAAKQSYEKGLKQWRVVLDKKDWPRECPNLVKDEDIGRDLVEITDRYRRILDKREEPFPKDYILQDVIALHGKDQEQKQK